MRFSPHYTLWYAADHRGMFDDLGKPIRLGWYVDLYPQDCPLPTTFGPFPTSDRADAEAKAKVEKAG